MYNIILLRTSCTVIAYLFIYIFIIRVENLHPNFRKSACFDDLDDDGIKNAVKELFPCLKDKDKEWRFFRCKSAPDQKTSTSDLEIAPEPENGWSIGELNR